MKYAIALPLFVLTTSLHASTFFNNADSKIMHAAAQYYQYGTSRIDAAIENSQSTANLVQTQGSQATRLQDVESDTSIHTLFFQRLFSSTGGVGLRLGYNVIKNTRSNDEGFFQQDQFNFQQTTTISEEQQTRVKISPLMSYTMASFLTLGVEVETEFGRHEDRDGKVQQFNSQTGIPSLTLHLMGFELGAVYRPTSRSYYTDLDNETEVTTRERKHSSMTGFMRLAVGEQFAFGGYVRTDNYQDYEGTNQSELIEPQQEYGMHVEYFRDPTTKFELIGSRTASSKQPDGVLSFQSAAKSSVTGAFTYRNERDSGFSAAVTAERMQQELELAPNAKAIAEGDRISISVSSYWKM